MLSNLGERKKKVMEFIDRIAVKREKYLKRNKYYYKDIIKYLKYNIPDNSKILEIGCGLGNVLNALNPSYGVGIDISGKMVELAKEKFPNITFYQMDAENIKLNEKFEYIVISDTLGYLEDIQKMISELKKVSDSNTRIIITYHNFLWQPILSFAEFIKLKMPQMRLNWLNRDDIENLLILEGFDVIKKAQRFLFPKFFPVISWFINKYISQLPLFNYFCLVSYIIARKKEDNININKSLSVSVLIPARNEKGNIEEAVLRCPKMGKHTEIIFVEGNSTDNTYEEIKRVHGEYKNKFDIKYAKQNGRGKGDAVRKGFSMAKGDILMILDADLTVPPEDLPKFYNAIASGKGEFINGTRLVYPMEREAMRFLNIIGNKFFSVIFSWMLGQRLKDTLCGTKVISKKNWERLVANRKYFGDFDPFGDFDLIFGSSKLNLKIIEVPIRYRARIYGDTNISRFKHGFLLLKMIFFALNKIKFI